MQGYYNRDDASAEATWTDRWATLAATGDLGQLDADGFLYVVDRKKDMILSGSRSVPGGHRADDA